MGCAFCDKGLINRQAEMFWVVIDPKTKNLVMILNYSGYQTQREIKINYCPYCGEKLTKDNN